MWSDVISIINFSLYRADYMLLVWPSAHPQAATTSPFDRHRAANPFKHRHNGRRNANGTLTCFSDAGRAHANAMAMVQGNWRAHWVNRADGT